MVFAHIIQPIDDGDTITINAWTLNLSDLQQLSTTFQKPSANIPADENITPIATPNDVIDSNTTDTAITFTFKNREAELVIDFSIPLIFRIFKDGKLVASVTKVGEAEKAVIQAVFDVSEEELKKK